MSEDYRELLSGKVEEVKERVEDLDDPDFEKLLKLEREDKDRKTVKEYLENLRDQAEEAAEEAVGEAEDEAEEELDSEDVEVTGGKPGSVSDSLNSLSPASLLGLGLVAGIVLGAGAAQMFAGGSGGYEASPSAVKGDMQELLSGPNRTVDVGSADRQHGMYYFNVSTTQQTPNGTSTSYRQFYVSSDGELLFPDLQIPLLGLQTPVNLQDALNQQRNATR